MKILVVGGAGYIGSVCAEVLLNEGHAVTIFDNLTEGHRRAIDPRAKFIEGDLASIDQIRTGARRQFRPDAVMHFAANALVGESMENPSKYFRNNVANGLNLLDAMVATGIKRLVFSSTCAIFGPPERVPIDETLPQRPINPYGESKLAFEKILRWYDEIHGLRFVSLRYFNAAGASENFGEESSHRNPSDSERAESGARAKAARRNLRHRLRDAGWHLHPRLHPHSRSGPGAHSRARLEKSDFYNLGTGGGASVREVIEAAGKVTGQKSARGKAAAAGRSAAIDRVISENQTASSAGSRISIARSHYRERVEMASEIPARLRRLSGLSVAR